MATATLRRTPTTSRRPPTASCRPLGYRRVKPHVPYEHSDVPGVCATCQLPIIVRYDGRYINDRHLTLAEYMEQLVVTRDDVMFAASGELPYGERPYG
jgi:hypothetical protein